MEPNSKEPLILIGIPTLDTIKTDTVISLMSTTAVTKYRAKLHILKSSVVHDARNKIVEKALEENASHVLFIDSDLKFPPWAMDMLVDQKKDIVAGVYVSKQIPHMPLVSKKTTNGKLRVVTDFPRDRVFEADAIATGFMLINMDVIKKIKPPYFSFDGEFNGTKLGEDYYFCLKARDAGFKVYADPRLELAHIGDYGFDYKDFDAYNDLVEKDQSYEYDGKL